MIKVMIAEDNIFISKNCFKFLTNDKDIKVISCAYDGEETIREYFKLQPDVLLLDLDMPKINGLDIINTIGRFTEERKKCNIIVVSGSTEHLYKLYNTAQVFRVIPKPADLDYILTTIKEIPVKTKELNQKELKEILAELRLNIFSSRVQQLITAISLAYEHQALFRTDGSWNRKADIEQDRFDYDKFVFYYDQKTNLAAIKANLGKDMDLIDRQNGFFESCPKRAFQRPAASPIFWNSNT